MNKLYLACLLFIFNFNSVFAYAIKKGSSSFDFITILGIATSVGITGWVLLWIGKKLDTDFFDWLGGFLFRSGFGTIAGFVVIIILGGILHLVEMF